MYPPRLQYFQPLFSSVFLGVSRDTEGVNKNVARDRDKEGGAFDRETG